MEATKTTMRKMIRVAVDPSGIPEYLTERPQWVVWRVEERDGKPTKVLYDASTGKQASTTDLMTWVPFWHALAVYEAGGYDGLGFVICSADPFVALDFDGCRDPESGAVDPEVLAFIDRFGHKYVEVSPSGTGLHLITRGSFKGGKKHGKIEMYGQDRFFTITGVAPNA